jgi:hypothetical protein
MPTAYQAFAAKHMKAGKSMKEVGALWRTQKGGTMRGGAAIRSKPRSKPKGRQVAVLAGRGMESYQADVMAGGGLKGANQMIGGHLKGGGLLGANQMVGEGFFDDMARGLGQGFNIVGDVVKTALPFLPLLL